MSDKYEIHSLVPVPPGYGGSPYPETLVVVKCAYCYCLLDEIDKYYHEDRCFNLVTEQRE